MINTNNFKENTEKKQVRKIYKNKWENFLRNMNTDGEKLRQIFIVK